MDIAQAAKGKKTQQFTVSVPWKTVDEKQESIIDSLVKEVEIKGFRKGKAPKELARNQLNQKLVVEEVLKDLASEAYQKILSDKNLTIVGRPKVELTQGVSEKPWEIVITVAEKPEIKLGNYKEEIKKIKTDKKGSIWVPGKDPEEKPPEKNPEVTLNEILMAFSKAITAEISDLLIEQETERMLSHLLQDAQKLGLTVERYLSSIGKTVEQLQSEYTKQAEETLKMEFALEQLAEDEKIVVEDKDIEEVLSKTADSKEKKSLEQNKYYLASLIRRQKVFNFLISL